MKEDNKIETRSDLVIINEEKMNQAIFFTLKDINTIDFKNIFFEILHSITSEENLKKMTSFVKLYETKNSGFIDSIILKIKNLLSNNEFKNKENLHKESHGATIESWLYQLMCELIEIQPYNKIKIKNSNVTTQKFVICPLSYEKLSYKNKDHITLSSGYIFRKAALLEWFEKTQLFKCPLTNLLLPQYEIDTLIKLDNGLKKIQKLEKEYESIKIQLLQNQFKKFNDNTLSIRDEIKVDFLILTQAVSDRMDFRIEENKNWLELLHKKINISYQQCEPYINQEAYRLENFSHVDLSGLCFYMNQLSPFISSRDVLDLRGANLSNCIFINENLSTNHCMHADLTDANLENIKFLSKLPQQGICIKNTNLTRANLRNADLTGIGNWANVNLTNAILIDAFLYNKDGIKITGTQLKEYLSGANGLDSVVFVLAQKDDISDSKFDKNSMINNRNNGLMFFNKNNNNNNNENLEHIENNNIVETENTIHLSDDNQNIHANRTNHQSTSEEDKNKNIFCAIF